jgi:hypothetical protein
VAATAVVAAVDTMRTTTALVHAQAVADVLQAATEVAATIATSAATSPSSGESSILVKGMPPKKSYTI